MLISFLPILPKLAVLPRLKSENPARGAVVATPEVRTDLRASGARRIEAVFKMLGSMYMPQIRTISDVGTVEREMDGMYRMALTVAKSSPCKYTSRLLNPLTDRPDGATMTCLPISAQI